MSPPPPRTAEHPLARLVSHLLAVFCSQLFCSTRVVVNLSFLMIKRAMREHVLCPSTEGCHSVFRGWSQPLGDFAVHEFLALHRLFSTSESAGAEAETHVLGEVDDVARRLMRDSVGPVPIRARLSESVADAIGRRLVAGTLHEIVCEGADGRGLRDAIQRSSTDGTLFSPDDGKSARRPHVLLQTFPGASDAGPIRSLGAKRRKAFLADVVKGTALDPTLDDEHAGCGPRCAGQKRPHVSIMWLPHKSSLALTRPVRAEDALRFVHACGECGEQQQQATATSRYDPAPPKPELAACIANIAMATGSSIAFDPFAGTGGLLRPLTEALGSPYVLGMDVVGGTCGTGRDMVAGNALRLPLRGEASQSQNQTQSQTQNQMGVYDVIVCDPPYGMRAPRIEGASGEKDPVVAGPRAMEAATMDFIRPIVAFAGSSCGLVSFSLF